jgi:hypothetical protein
MARTFLLQRFYPTLRLGFSANAVRNGGTARVHCRQGDWDGACGPHCAAMALAVLGRIADFNAVSRGRKGISARLWDAAQETYFKGTDTIDLVYMLESLQTDLRVNYYDGTHRRTLAFTQKRIADGELVIVSWRTKDYAVQHWVLVIGIEGVQEGRSFTPNTLLIMDPGLAEPIMSGYNARLQFTSYPIPHSSIYIDYLTNEGSSLPVTLTGAVSIRDVA